MPSTIQKAIAFEAFINTPAIVGLLCFPSATLRPFLASSLPSLELSATTMLLARYIGVLFLALTSQLLLAYPDCKDCLGKRRLVYWTLGVGEAGLIPLFLWEAFRTRDGAKTAGVSAGSFSRNSALICAAILTWPIAWRIFVFQWRPRWFAAGATGNTDRKKA